MDWNRVGALSGVVFAQGWSFFAVALTVYLLGESVKNLAQRRGWRSEHPDEASWFDATLPIQPVIVGALLMQIPFPVWAAIDGLDKDPNGGAWTEAAARLAYGALAGALCGQIFEIIQTLLRYGRKRLGMAEDGRKTPVTSAPKLVPSAAVVVVTPVPPPDAEPSHESEPEEKPRD